LFWKLCNSQCVISISNFILKSHQATRCYPSTPIGKHPKNSPIKRQGNVFLLQLKILKLLHPYSGLGGELKREKIRVLGHLGKSTALFFSCDWPLKPHPF